MCIECPVDLGVIHGREGRGTPSHPWTTRQIVRIMLENWMELPCIIHDLCTEDGLYPNGWFDMTLQPYGPDKLDHFALQLLDLATAVRQMANRCREHGVDDLVLHDKKAQEWRIHLDEWVHKAQVDVEMRIHQRKARRRAATFRTNGGV
jgi:hypothetical protein